MSKQAVIDRLGKTLGMIETKADGRQSALTEAGALIATFVPQSNETIDASGQMMAEGNVLMSLLESRD